METIKELEAEINRKYYTEIVRGSDLGYLKALKDVKKLIDEWKKGMILRLETARNLEQIRYKDFDLFEEFINEKTKELKARIDGK